MWKILLPIQSIDMKISNNKIMWNNTDLTYKYLNCKIAVHNLINVNSHIHKVLVKYWQKLISMCVFAQFSSLCRCIYFSESINFFPTYLTTTLNFFPTSYIHCYFFLLNFFLNWFPTQKVGNLQEYTPLSLCERSDIQRIFQRQFLINHTSYLAGICLAAISPL